MYPIVAHVPFVLATKATVLATLEVRVFLQKGPNADMLRDLQGKRIKKKRDSPASAVV